MPFTKKRKQQYTAKTTKRYKSSKTAKRPSRTLRTGFVTKKGSSKVELKRVTQTFATTSVAANDPTIIAFPAIATGDLSYSRDGRAIQMKGFQSRWIFNPNTSGEDCNFRVIYFVWKQATVVPTAGLILTYSTTEAVYAPYNILQASNYTILSDDTYNANPMSINRTSAALYAPNILMFNKSKLLSLTQTYNDGATLPNDRAVYILFISRVQCSISGAIATSFVDI